MDNLTSALKYIVLFLPLTAVCKVIEKVGILYGLLEYPFQKGKRKAQKTYDKLKL